MEKTWRVKLPEWLVWRLYGDSVESDTFFRDFMVKLVWKLSGVFMETILYIKLPDNTHTNFTIKSP